ncbi:serine/threonine-protein kinase pim-1-like isoform 1-T4 [Clarias gariepinus]
MTEDDRGAEDHPGRTWDSDVMQWDEIFSKTSVSADDMEHASSSAPEPQDGHLQEFHPSQHYEFDARYAVVELLAKERYGTLYTGVHKADGKKVGIKCVMKNPTDELITIPEQMKMLPLEVALIKLVSKPPLCKNVVELLDWFETSTFFFLVVERTNPCMDLRDFCKLDNGRLAEPVAQKVMQQVVRAACHCCEHGVLHCDFEQNLLINPDTLEVKLVDFGCAEVMTDELYTDFPGNLAFSPPEWVQYRKYFGFPAIIWGVGVLLFELVCGELPFCNEKEIVEGLLPFIPGLSDECCNLIQQCLNKDPECRPTFKEILDHKWFKKSLEDTAM